MLFSLFLEQDKITMACCSAADVCREDAFTKMAADHEMPEDEIAELLGDPLDSRLSRLTQLPLLPVFDR
jgi:hypothetical protein